jgi:hypothetical protein
MLHDRLTGRARVATLLSLGSVVLHQLRYVVAHPHHPGAALAHDGHDRVSLALPIMLSLALVVVVSGLLFAAISRRASATASPNGSGLVRRALAYALVLMLAFAGQELVEGALLSGHPEGIDALLGNGGFVVVPLAGLLGALISLLAGALGAAERRIVGALVRPWVMPADPPKVCAAPDVERLSGRGFALGFAPRAPPSFSRPG